MILRGVDGCPAGWIAASLDLETGKVTGEVFKDVASLLSDPNRVLRENPEIQPRVFEVHPELCFYFWADEKPMRHPKRTGFGFAERLELVRTVFGRAAEEVREKYPRAEVNDDDILDALAALWTARRIHAGTAVKLPQGREQLDACGLPMRMLA